MRYGDVQCYRTEDTKDVHLHPSAQYNVIEVIDLFSTCIPGSWLDDGDDGVQGLPVQTQGGLTLAEMHPSAS